MIGQRIMQLIDLVFEGNQNKFAKKLGISQPTLNNIVSDKNKPSYEFIETILNSDLDISCEWLIKGNGSMFNNKSLKRSFKKLEATQSDIAKNEIVKTYFNEKGIKYIRYNDVFGLIVPLIEFNQRVDYISYVLNQQNIVFKETVIIVDDIKNFEYVAFVSHDEHMNRGKLEDTPGDTIMLCRLIEDFNSPSYKGSKYGEIYVTKQGVYFRDYKKFDTETATLIISSRNKRTKDIKIHYEDILQVFEVEKRLL